MLASKRDFERTEGLKRVIAVRSFSIRVRVKPMAQN